MVTAFVVVVFLNVGFVHLSHIAQDMCPHAVGIVAYGAFFYGKTFEAEQFLAEHGELFRRNLAHEELWRMA